jgi:hypothetical protein
MAQYTRLVAIHWQVILAAMRIRVESPNRLTHGGQRCLAIGSTVWSTRAEGKGTGATRARVPPRAARPLYHESRCSLAVW